MSRPAVLNEAGTDPMGAKVATGSVPMGAKAATGSVPVAAFISWKLYLIRIDSSLSRAS